MSKKVSINANPNARKAPAAHADQWVEHRQTESTKRLTIDVPESLHSRIKATCALRGIKMNEAIRELLEAHFTEEAVSV